MKIMHKRKYIVHMEVTIKFVLSMWSHSLCHYAWKRAYSEYHEAFRFVLIMTILFQQ